MEEFQMYEYVVAPKKEGSYLLKRILMILSVYFLI